MPEQQKLLDLGPGKRRRPRPRRERDAYYTPQWATATLIERAPEVRGVKLLDPCCGDGRMAQAVMEAGRFERCSLNDIAQVLPEVLGCTYRSHVDACDLGYAGWGEVDWVVTNSPWNASGRIAWTALQHARVGVALLLRITWLEPCAGREWLTRLPPTRMIVLPRVCYDGSGQTDSATSAWFIWQRDPETGEWKRGGIEVTDGAAGQGALSLEER